MLFFHLSSTIRLVPEEAHWSNASFGNRLSHFRYHQKQTTYNFYDLRDAKACPQLVKRQADQLVVCVGHHVVIHS